MASSELWARVVGQPAAVALLDGAARQPVHAYLFVGPAGSGKRAAARAFAAALVCPHGGDGTCRDCRLALAGEHPDVREVERVGAAITVEQAGEIVRLAALAPVEGARKVMILDEFHLLQPPAAAKLLKTVEEPPASTVFCILADDVPPELVTIASRCVRVELRRLTDETVREALVAEGVALETAAIAAHASGGDLDRARLLAGDPALAARRKAFAELSDRLDGRGAAVAAAVDELLGLIDGAAAPLQARHEAELATLEERVAQVGERGSGRKATEERQRRELRRHRADELRAGLGALAASYRDELVRGSSRAAEATAAVRDIHAALEAMERNPNEALLLQALFLRLPPSRVTSR
jgi:DNA polymerase III subunit delta'